MKIKKVLAAAFALSTVTIVPASAQAEEPIGYIRIGDSCYMNTGVGPNSYPVLINIPCPNTVSGE